MKCNNKNKSKNLCEILLTKCEKSLSQLFTVDLGRIMAVIVYVVGSWAIYWIFMKFNFKFHIGISGLNQRSMHIAQCTLLYTYVEIWRKQIAKA